MIQHGLLLLNTLRQKCVATGSNSMANPTVGSGHFYLRTPKLHLFGQQTKISNSGWKLCPATEGLSTFWHLEKGDCRVDNQGCLMNPSFPDKNFIDPCWATINKSFEQPMVIDMGTEARLSIDSERTFSCGIIEVHKWACKLGYEEASKFDIEGCKQMICNNLPSGWPVAASGSWCLFGGHSGCYTEACNRKTLEKLCVPTAALAQAYVVPRNANNTKFLHPFQSFLWLGIGNFRLCPVGTGSSTIMWAESTSCQDLIIQDSGCIEKNQIIPNEHCDILPLQSRFAFIDYMETDLNHDFLEVNGIRYSGRGSIFFRLEAGEIVKWTSDAASRSRGWRICPANNALWSAAVPMDAVSNEILKWECADVHHWHDSNGYTCDHYVSLGFCTITGQMGIQWILTYPHLTFNDVARMNTQH